MSANDKQNKKDPITEEKGDQTSAPAQNESGESEYLLNPIVKEPRLCAFCEDMKMSEKAPGFLKIDSTNHVGNIPIVISKRCNNSDWICIVHWEKNKKEWKEKMSHDSFSANPLSVDVLTEVSAQKGSILCPSENDANSNGDAFSSVKGVTIKEEHLAELQQKAFKSAAASLPSGVFVSVPAISDCLDYSNLSGLDLNKLSPLFIQFLAWQRLMQINQQIRLMSTNSVDKASVLKLIQEASNGTVQSHQQNPIIPNYKLSHTPKNNTPGNEPGVNSSTSPGSLTETASSSSTPLSSSSSLLSSASNSKCAYTPLLDSDHKKSIHLSKSDKKAIAEADQFAKKTLTPLPMTALASNTSSASEGQSEQQQQQLAAAKRKKSGDADDKENDVSDDVTGKDVSEGPDAKKPRLSPLDDVEEIKKLEKRIPRITEIRSKVPQKTSFAYISGYNGHVVLCELSKKESFIGRSGKKDVSPELDLTGLVENIKKVSHKQCAIVWNESTKSFTVKGLSKNGFNVDGTPVLCNTEVNVRNGSRIVIHQFELVFVIPKEFTHPQ